jgi:hypothetical protein
VQQARIDRRLESIESSVSYLAEILFSFEHVGELCIFVLKREHQSRNTLSKGRVTETQHKRTHSEETTLIMILTSLCLNFGKLKAVGVNIRT